MLAELLNRSFFAAAVPLALTLCALFLLLRARLFPIFSPRVIRFSLFGREEGGGTSPLSALFSALSGTLGVGNLSGVALALSSGGAGAVFWMWVSALFASVLKYAEITLAVAFRRFEGGKPHGGAPLYLSAAFPGRPGRALSLLFTFFCAGGALFLGSGVQSLAVAETMEATFSFPPLLSGLLFSLFTLLALSENAKKLSAVTGRLVPFLTFLYLGVTLWILLSRASLLPALLARILREAFSFRAAAGGSGGFFLSRAVRWGFVRGLVSNEAGCGTAPFAHAAVNQKLPAAQGIWGIAEVMIDTPLFCTLTALTLLLAFDGAVPEGAGMGLVFLAFHRTIGGLSRPFLAAAVFLFAYGTTLCQAYYGCEALFLVGAGQKARKTFLFLFLLFSLAAPLLPASFLWEHADLFCSAALCLNTSALFSLADKTGELTRELLAAVSAGRSERKKVRRTPRDVFRGGGPSSRSPSGRSRKKASLPPRAEHTPSRKNPDPPTRGRIA